MCFRKVDFPKVSFPKVYFPKVYFSKVYLEMILVGVGLFNLSFKLHCQGLWPVECKTRNIEISLCYLQYKNCEIPQVQVRKRIGPITINTMQHGRGFLVCWRLAQIALHSGHFPPSHEQQVMMLNYWTPQTLLPLNSIHATQFRKQIFDTRFLATDDNERMEIQYTALKNTKSTNCNNITFFENVVLLNSNTF